MRPNILFYVFLFTTISFAQQRIISGIIKDSDTKLPIDLVSISIKDTNLGTVSNNEGKFQIIIPNGYSKLNFHHINYKFNEREVGKESIIEIFLSSKEYLLDEVTIDKISGKDLLAETVVASKKKTDKSILFNTYYRELNKIDNHYTNFSEGILVYNNYFNDKSQKGESSARISSDLYIKQSRVFDLRDSSQNKMPPIFFDIKNNIKVAYNLNWIEFNILNHYKKYNFQVETKMESNGNSIKIIYIKPKEGKKVKFPYFLAGKVICDSKTKLILNIDLKYSDELKKYSKIVDIGEYKIKLNDVVMRSDFKIENNTYLLTYNQMKFNFYIKAKGREIFNNTFECASDLTVLSYEEGKFDLDKTKKYQKKALFENGNSYTEEFWKTQNIVPLSDKEEATIKELNENSISTKHNNDE